MLKNVRVMSGNPDTLMQFRSYLIPVCDVVKCNVVFRDFMTYLPFHIERLSLLSFLSQIESET